MLAGHHDRPGNGPRSSGGSALDESANLCVSRKALVERADDYHEKIYRQENTQRGSADAGFCFGDTLIVLVDLVICFKEPLFRCGPQVIEIGN